MNRPKAGWHIGQAKTDIYESCTGFIEAGHYYLGEGRPYSYRFWGLVWRGDYTFGIGRAKYERYDAYTDTNQNGTAGLDLK